tara:strand:- start:321 stop:884 length:564 start_codon:yes stop_codon:yes gene_type:complete
MEQAIEQKPISTYIPFAFLVTALFSFYIVFLNRVDLKPGQVEYPEVQFIAPSFELPSINGGKVNLRDYRGKVVFINFWATWCSTCKVEMPSMERLYQRFKNKRFEMLTISVDKEQGLVSPYVEKYSLSFPVLMDPESDVAKKLYKTTGVPETFIVDQNGVIIFKAIGPRDWSTDETIQAFEQMLGRV